MYKNRLKFISSSLYGYNYTKCTMEQYFSDATYYIEGQIEFQNRFPTDIIPCPVYIVGEALQFGATQKVKALTAPTIWKYSDEVKRVSIDEPLNLEHDYFEYMFKCCEGLKLNFPDKQLLAFISSPLDFGIMVFGLPKWLEMLLFEEDLFFKWLKKFIDYHNEYKNALVHNGVNYIAISNVFINNKIISLMIIKEKIIPFLNEHNDPQIKTIIHSSFMPLTATIKCLEDLDTGSGYVINESDDITEVANLLNSDKLLVGNIGSEYIYKKTPETIINKTYDVLSKTHDIERFVLATTGADLALDTSEEQIYSIYKGIERYEEDYK